MSGDRHTLYIAFKKACPTIVRKPSEFGAVKKRAEENELALLPQNGVTSLMVYLGWRSTNHVLFLAPDGGGGPE